jgi:hypothetical protein
VVPFVDTFRPVPAIGVTVLTDASNGQVASSSEMTLTANGHSIPNSGSFQRNPCSSVASQTSLT